MSYDNPKSVIYDLQSTLPDVGWQDLQLTGSIAYHVNPAYGCARYCRINGIVYVNIMVDFVPASATIATLPVGFRPSQQLLVTGLTYPLNHTRVDIYPSGVITAYTPTTTDWTAITESFPVDA